MYMCGYMHIYMYLKVFTILSPSGNLHAIPFLGRGLSQPSPNSYPKPGLKSAAEQGWALWASLLGLGALLGQLCRAPRLGSRWLLQIPGSFRVHSGALEPAVGVLAVVERHAMDTEHVGLQISLLRGTVGAVSALERPVTCMTDDSPVSFAQWPLRENKKSVLFLNKLHFQNSLLRIARAVQLIRLPPQPQL